MLFGRVLIPEESHWFSDCCLCPGTRWVSYGKGRQGSDRRAGGLTVNAATRLNTGSVFQSKLTQEHEGNIILRTTVVKQYILANLQ
jgi:hypothetical protein